MARYEIVIFRPYTGTTDGSGRPIMEKHERRRRNSAADTLYRLVYEEIRAHAGLDTAWGRSAADGAAEIGRRMRAGIQTGGIVAAVPFYGIEVHAARAE